MLQIFESTYYKIYEREYEIYYFGYVQRNIFLYAEEIVGMKAMVFFYYFEIKFSLVSSLVDSKKNFFEI